MKPQLSFRILLWILPILLASIGLGATPTGVIAKGTPAETPWYVIDSGKPGPVIFISGGVHGDEPAGAAAAGGILEWPITQGKIILLPRANVVSLAAHKRNIPGLSTNLSNLNRDFPRAHTNEPPRGELATAIWEVVQAQKPDWLLDLHEGFDFNIANSKSVGSSVIAHPAKEGRKIAQLMLDAVNPTIPDAQHKFDLRGPPVDGSLAGGAAEHLGCGAMILETTTKGQPLERRVAQHHVMVKMFLTRMGMLAAAPAAAVLPLESGAPNATGNDSKSAAALRGSDHDVTLVALYDSEGSFGAGVKKVTEQLGKSPRVRLAIFKPEDFRAGKLEGYNVVIFTGGSGSKQGAAVGEDGRAKINQFVQNGGGYLGICAGAYLACENYTWGLKIIDAKTASPKWLRGKGNVQIELTDQGRAIFGDWQGAFTILYANGPILKPAEVESIPDFEPLAYFRTELAEHDTPKGIMVNSPAIVAGHFGKGRVICSSPHPEQTTGLEDFVPKAIQWLAPAGKPQDN
jgi:predicted deacylase